MHTKTPKQANTGAQHSCDTENPSRNAAFTEAEQGGGSAPQSSGAGTAPHQAGLDAHKQTNAGYCLPGIAESLKSGADAGGGLGCTSTGFHGLDDAIGGGLETGLCIVGGISSVGKTSLGLNVADNIAMSGTTVIFHSVEQSRHELIKKSISRHAAMCAEREGLSARDNAKSAKKLVGYPTFTELERRVIDTAIEDYGAYAGNINIHEHSASDTIASVRKSVEDHINLIGKHPVVIVDYLQVLAMRERHSTDKQKVDKVVLELRQIARDFAIPVIVISSISRHAYKEVFAMESFKESGIIEYSSDVLIGMQLEGSDNKDFDLAAAKRSNPRKVELVILKNRDWEGSGVVRLDYYHHFNLFKDARVKS